MSKNVLPILNDEPKYKKKSSAKGQSRSKHKHEYKTVLLHYIVPNFDDKTKTHEILSAKKVCAICGRISETDYNQYENVNVALKSKSGLFDHIIEKRIKNPESLEDWYAYGYIAKTAFTYEELVARNVAYGLGEHTE